MRIEMAVNCGPMRQGSVYDVLGKGFDYYTIRYKGRPVIVPMAFCQPVGSTFKKVTQQKNRKLSKYRPLNDYSKRLSELTHGLS